MEEVVGWHHVKGVLYSRPPLTCTAEMQAWAAGQKEKYRPFSKEVLQVGCCGEHTHLGDADVLAASQRLVRNLPASLAGPIRSDAMELATMMLRLCPDGSHRQLTLQVVVLGRNACSRWHQDHIISRAIVTYNGPGTWLVSDASVRFDQLEATRGMPDAVSDPAIVPRREDIHCPGPNDVVFMKGGKWRGIEGVKGREGLTHKSPTIPSDAQGNPTLHRIMLKVDIDGADH